MSAEEIEQAMYREPFQPYRLVLIDGEEVTVSVPRKGHVSGAYVALVGESRRPDGSLRYGLRMFKVDRVASVVEVAAQDRSEGGGEMA